MANHKTKHVNGLLIGLAQLMTAVFPITRPMDNVLENRVVTKVEKIKKNAY
ncbi:hypothetical protein [Pedobacter sp.]|uniref:hypothetical protein n=1 Tax=Pedobacter sp. TaxID=1411316 RepID=UPI003BAAEEDE